MSPVRVNECTCDLRLENVSATGEI